MRLREIPCELTCLDETERVGIEPIRGGGIFICDPETGEPHTQITLKKWDRDKCQT